MSRAVGPAPPVDVEPRDEHNRALVANVHPPDWENPTPAGRYNLVVIGAGTAGLVTAVGAAGLGARVALVERELMGGDCLNVGCVPSKALLRAARAYADVRAAGDFGVRVPAGVARRVRRGDGRGCGGSARRSASTTRPQRFRGLGVDVFLGAGRFTGPDTIEVEGRTLRFAKADHRHRRPRGRPGHRRAWPRPAISPTNRVHAHRAAAVAWP